MTLTLKLQPETNAISGEAEQYLIYESKDSDFYLKQRISPYLKKLIKIKNYNKDGSFSADALYQFADGSRDVVEEYFNLYGSLKLLQIPVTILDEIDGVRI